MNTTRFCDEPDDGDKGRRAEKGHLFEMGVNILR